MTALFCDHYIKYIQGIRYEDTHLYQQVNLQIGFVRENPVGSLTASQEILNLPLKLICASNSRFAMKKIYIYLIFFFFKSSLYPSRKNK